jgi:subtilisin family serine protease
MNGGSFVRNSTLILIIFILSSIPTWGQNYVPGEVLVKLKGKASFQARQQFLGKVQSKASLKSSFSRMNIHHMSLKAGTDLQQVINELKNDPDVEYAEPNYIITKLNDLEVMSEAMSIDDVKAQNQALSSTSYSQSLANTQVTESWSELSASVAVTPVVAVIDTGVDYTHPVFVNSGAIWSNAGELGTDVNGNNKATNGIDDDGNGYVDDYRGWNFFANNNAPMDDDEHGTHVAGIILGISQNIFATTLQPAKVKIMPLKFLGADGSGTTSSAISAIYYAVRNGAKIINNSWGGSNYSQSLHDALAYAYNEKVTLVAAAGNYNSNNDSAPLYPANYPVPSQLSIAATNDYDNRASFSNFGKSSVHVASPGVGIVSTIPGNQYRYLSGTSMAAPFVAGMAAMLYREANNLSGYQIKNLILSSIDTKDILTNTVITGGRVNELKAVQAAKSQISILSEQPNYVAEPPSAARAPAEAAPAKTGGCGLITTALMGAGGSGGATPSASVLIALLTIPLIVWFVIRQRASGKGRRRFDRFMMNSDIKLNVGGRELVGHMRTISEGGLSFSAETMLEKGGVVTINITSPDGSENVQVQGHIVWSEQNQAYGVQFDHAREGVVMSIRRWTASLMRV